YRKRADVKWPVNRAPRECSAGEPKGRSRDVPERPQGEYYSLLARGAFDGRIDGNVILVENRADGALKGSAGFDVCALGGNFRGPRLRPQAFILDDKEAGGSAHVEFGLFNFKGLLLQFARLRGSLIRSSRAAHGDERVFYFQPRLVFHLAQADLRLLHLNFVARQVGFRD